MTTKKILGIEGGGTKTAWALVSNDTILESGKLPPSNLRLTPLPQIRHLFRRLPQSADRVGVFLAGCATEKDHAVLAQIANEIWTNAAIVVGSDRDSGLAAALRDRDGIVVNAGTGSSVTGRRGRHIEKAGGWGHILGDTGGAYFVSIRALRVILRDYDLREENRKFAAEILRALQLNDFDGLVRWAQTADKTEVASLAPIVFAAAEGGDEAVQRILQAGAVALANFTLAVAHRLDLNTPEVRLMGGLFENQQSYRAMFVAALDEMLPGAAIGLAETPPEFGAIWLAMNGEPVEKRPSLPSTEALNPRSSDLDQLSAADFVKLFLDEEEAVEAALRDRAQELAHAIETTAETIASGGRIFYVGAGTSGRLGALDAAEIPPTFGASADLFQAIVAGGPAALQRSVEGAEDDAASGSDAIAERKISQRDLVVGISASGSAKFVTAALARGRELGAKTILLTCNPNCSDRRVAEQPNSPEGRDYSEAHLVIVLPTGPEIVAGSTRLKAGTATKIALNIISTGAMVRLGHVQGNLMIDLQPTNKKLRERAVRLVSQLGRCDGKTALARLEKCDWNIRAALKQAQR